MPSEWLTACVALLGFLPSVTPPCSSLGTQSVFHTRPLHLPLLYPCHSHPGRPGAPHGTGCSPNVPRSDCLCVHPYPCPHLLPVPLLALTVVHLTEFYCFWSMPPSLPSEHRIQKAGLSLSPVLCSAQHMIGPHSINICGMNGQRDENAHP